MIDFEIGDDFIRKKDGSEWTVIDHMFGYYKLKKKEAFSKVTMLVHPANMLEYLEPVVTKPKGGEVINNGGFSIKLDDAGFISGFSVGNPKDERNHNHYYKDVSEFDEMDVYLLCKLYNVRDESGCLHHAIKKLLVLGERGHKDRKTDLQNAIDTLVRLQEIEGIFDEIDRKKERHDKVVRDWQAEKKNG